MSDTKTRSERLAETLASPVLWGQAYLRNRNGGPRVYWPHQAEDLLAPETNVIHLDGRAAGKCARGSTTVLDCDSGERVRIDQLKPGRRIPVLAKNLTITTTREYSVHENGLQECFRLTTAMGRQIEVTANHPILTDEGWRPLADLEPNDWLAVPRCLPVSPCERLDVSDDELALLAYFIADGGLSASSANFTKADPLIVEDFHEIVARLFPATRVVPAAPLTYRVSIGLDGVRSGAKNPCIEFLRRWGLMGCRSDEKVLAPAFFELSNRQLGLFLSRLYGCDGWVCKSNLSGRVTGIEIGYCSASRPLAQAIQHLLLRFEILAYFRTKIVNGKGYWCVEIRDLDQVERFGRAIGFFGIKQFHFEELVAERKPTRQYSGSQDLVPVGPVKREVDELLDQGWLRSDIVGGGHRRLRLHRYNPTRWLVDEFAENTGVERLHELASSDIYWDRVASIEPVGAHPTYDLSVPGFRNFIADDIVVHNSVCVSTDVLHFAFTTRGGQGLIAAPHQGHIDTLVEEIEFQLDANPDLMASIAMTKQGKPKIHRKPYFRLEFTNGSVIYFRPAGAYGDAFRSLHVDRIWVDEGAWLTEKSWKALRQCLKANGRLRIYSTPNGLRDTTYYRLTLSPQFKVFRWPSWVNPTWSPEREEELLEFYGGRETAGWQHEVAGEHGKPSYGAFNVEQLNLCRQDILEYQKVVITGEELKDCENEGAVAERLEMLMNLMPQTGIFWIGGDLGYTNDPTEIVVFREQEVGDRTVVRMIVRIHLEHVAYPYISQVIALLERFFSPTGIGVDNGGNGLAVVQELLTLDRFRPLGLEGRLRGYDFGGMTTLAIRDGKEVKKRTKELMTTLINGAFQRKELVLPIEDSEIEDQFTTHTYTLSNGNVVYSKGNDHIIDAVRCAALVREQGKLDQVREENVSLVPVLTDPVFV